MAYSINSTIKHGKYTEKIDSTHLQQVYLETGVEAKVPPFPLKVIE